MKSGITPVNELIPESNLVIFSPHFDDFLFMLGGYVNELQKSSLLATKNFHILLIFSRSNYLAGTGINNFDSSLDRIKLATGKRLLEEQKERMKAIVQGYMKLSPATRFGITMWGVSDGDSWLTEDHIRSKPLLFNSNYKLKPAYCGFLEGLSQ